MVLKDELIEALAQRNLAERQLAEAKQTVDALSHFIDRLQNEQAAVLPENVSLTDYVGALTRRAEEAEAALRARVDRMEALGRSGITISVCCGPSGLALFRWTVDVLNRKGRSFDRPFAANSFDHAIEIAEKELIKRGWL